MTNDRQVGFRIPTDLLEALRAIAEEQDRSINWIVRKALRDWIEARGKEKGK